MHVIHVHRLVTLLCFCTVGTCPAWFNPFVCVALQESLSTLNLSVPLKDTDVVGRAILALVSFSKKSSLSKADCDLLEQEAGVLLQLTPGQLELLVRAGRLKPLVDWMRTTGVVLSPASPRVHFASPPPPPLPPPPNECSHALRTWTSHSSAVHSSRDPRVH